MTLIMNVMAAVPMDLAPLVGQVFQPDLEPGANGKCTAISLGLIFEGVPVTVN
jgi:hypothetical protein